MLDFFFGRPILPAMDELPIPTQTTEPPPAQTAPDESAFAQVTSGTEVMKQVLLREAPGDPDFQMTPSARAYVVSIIQRLPQQR